MDAEGFSQVVGSLSGLLLAAAGLVAAIKRRRSSSSPPTVAPERTEVPSLEPAPFPPTFRQWTCRRGHHWSGRSSNPTYYSCPICGAPALYDGDTPNPRKR